MPQSNCQARNNVRFYPQENIPQITARLQAYTPPSFYITDYYSGKPYILSMTSSASLYQSGLPSDSYYLYLDSKMHNTSERQSQIKQNRELFNNDTLYQKPGFTAKILTVFIVKPCYHNVLPRKGFPLKEKTSVLWLLYKALVKL